MLNPLHGLHKIQRAVTETLAFFRNSASNGRCRLRWTSLGPLANPVYIWTLSVHLPLVPWPSYKSRTVKRQKRGSSPQNVHTTCYLTLGVRNVHTQFTVVILDAVREVTLSSLVHPLAVVDVMWWGDAPRALNDTWSCHLSIRSAGRKK